MAINPKQIIQTPKKPKVWLYRLAAYLYLVIALVFGVLAVGEMYRFDLTIFGAQLIRKDFILGVTYSGLALSCLSFSAAVAAFLETARNTYEDRVATRSEWAQAMDAQGQARRNWEADSLRIEQLLTAQREQQIQMKLQERVIQDLRSQKF